MIKKPDRFHEWAHDEMRHVVSEAERRSEIPVAGFRIAIFIVLLWLDFETGLSSHISNYLYMIIAVYGTGSLISLIVAARRIRASWMNYLFSFLDVTALSASISLIELVVGISKDHLMLLPVFSLIFIMLIHSSLRYDYTLVLFTALAFIATLFLFDATARYYPPEGVGQGHNFLIDGETDFLSFIAHWADYRVISITFVCVSAAILCYLTYQTRRMLRASVVREAQVSRLSRHFPPEVVKELYKSKNQLDATQRKKVVVVFADIVGFTEFVDTSSAADVVDLLQEFHEIAETAVFENGGTLHKFLGDGIMTTFGAPLEASSKSRSALACAFQMIAEIHNLNLRRSTIGLPPIRLSVGIHIGEALLGQIGSARRTEYTVIGDVVNVASRLESLTRELGVQVAVSHDFIMSVRREARQSEDTDIAQFRSVGPVAVQGKPRPIDVWVWAPESISAIMEKNYAALTTA